ncbi:MAG: undecaprenyl-diphosphate phosphatase [Candidatus Micrarchaeia archaeon]|jgi:undecaprenyl-diphosphatase
MDIFQAVILGTLQGIFEWIPVSSEAIVTLAGKYFFGFDYSDAISYAIWLHIGTLISAIVYFRAELIKIVKSIFNKNDKKELLIFLITATFFSGIVALPLLYFAFNFPFPDWIFTIFVGLFLIIISFAQKMQKEGIEKRLTIKNGIILGIFQGFSALPGISRSGITIAALLFRKYDLENAFKLSFLASIPIVFLAQISLPLIKEGFSISLSMIIGAGVSAVIGFLTIGILINFARKANFSKATLILGIIVIILGVITYLA